jgi:hypothetical protein
VEHQHISFRQSVDAQQRLWQQFIKGPHQNKGGVEVDGDYL